MRVETVILYGNSLYWFGNSSQGPGTSLIAQLVKSPPAMQETLVRSLGLRKIPWRRKWQPTPVLLPGESHGGRSLVGYSPWGHKETERLHFDFHTVMNRAFQWFFTITPGTLSQTEGLLFPGGGRRQFQCPAQVSRSLLTISVHASLIPSVNPCTLSDGALQRQSAGEFVFLSFVFFFFFI